VKKWVLAGGLTVALVVVALLLRNRDDIPEVVSPPHSNPIQTPSHAMSALLQAAGDEDAEEYLRLTGGDLRQSMDQMRAELGAEGFREHLRKFAAGVKGVAVFGEDATEANVVTLDVEFIFADRNERQRVTLARRGDGWVITSMDRAQMVKPPIPYGTPVFEEPSADEQSEGEDGP